MDSEEDDLIPFSLKDHLEGNNETAKASTSLGNRDRIKIACQVFGPSLQLHEMQEIDDDTRIKPDYLQSSLLSRLARHIFAEESMTPKKKGAPVPSAGRE